ncbi:MAG: TlpA disulfide reductase family protein [Proteobacteria bacterium]|nr:TlpA disulfide reductase family protein [Pseudomonadota bacterium]
MEKGIHQKLFFNSLFILILLLSLQDYSFALQVGEPFPEFSITNTLSAEELSSIQAKAGKEIALKDIGYNIVLVEFLNVYCHTCRMQVQVFNELYSVIKKDPVLSQRVCMLGIAVGNSLDEIQEFKKNFGALYPILPDPQKAVFNMTGNIHGTPQTYILSGDKERFIIDYHPGAVSSPERYLKSLQNALRGEITGTEPGNKIPAYSFSCREKSCSQKDFSGKKVLIYFPARKQYDLPSDTRKPQTQLEILSPAAAEFPDLQFIIFPSPEFSQAVLDTMRYPNVYFPEQADEHILKQFSVTSDPSIYYVNVHGRISFAGPCITTLNIQEIFKGKDVKTAPALSSAEIIKLIETEVKQMGEQLVSTGKTTLDNSVDVYVTMLAPRTRGAYLFSRVESKLSVCDVCHDSHFIYIFDQEGIIKSFTPIALTKYGNVPWTPEDIKKMRSGIVGKSIFGSFAFNPKVDAVSTATMTSSLIFEALRLAKNNFSDFKNYQFRQKHWEAMCFHTMCIIKDAADKMKKAGINPVINGTDFDFEHMKKYLPDGNRPVCPLAGNYLPLGENILCSAHGINLKGCGK